MPGNLLKRQASVLDYLNVGPAKLSQPPKSRKEINRDYYERMKPDRPFILEERLKKLAVASKKYQNDLKDP